MATVGSPECTSDWLALRESADAAARASELLDPLRAHLASAPRAAEHLVICDIGCGTGSMGRWLAGQLDGPQVWILHDRDPDLLDRASASMADSAADGSPVAVVTQEADITHLRADDLSDTSLVTASAVLDLLSREQVDKLAAACVDAGCPALLTLSVVGRVDLSPADPFDAEIAAAFNAHQRRVTRGRRLLGPDAACAAAEAFQQRGAAVHSRPSLWQLGPDQPELMAEWLRGWVDAACEQRPDLAPQGGAYLRRRLEECDAGKLRVTVHHIDLLVLPAAGAVQ